MAFGITLCFSRLGSVLNFFLTESFQESYGLKMTLWGGKCWRSMLGKCVSAQPECYYVRYHQTFCECRKTNKGLWIDNDDESDDVNDSNAFISLKWI